MEEIQLVKICVKNDLLGVDLQNINLKDIANNKLNCALKNAQKANNTLTKVFDEIFSKEDQEKLAEITQILDTEFDKIIEGE